MRVNATATATKVASVAIRKRSRNDDLVRSILDGPAATMDYLDSKGALSDEELLDTIRSICLVLSYLMSGERGRSGITDERVQGITLRPISETEVIDLAKAASGRYRKEA